MDYNNVRRGHVSDTIVWTPMSDQNYIDSGLSHTDTGDGLVFIDAIRALPVREYAAAASTNACPHK